MADTTGAPAEGAANDLPERPVYLALLAGAPAVWAIHFLLTYMTAAVWCARFAGRGGSLAPLTTAIVIYTVAALAGILFIGWGGYQRHQYGQSTLPHDFDSREDRHRFLGFSTLLLAGLSAIATLFIAGAALAIDVCM